jgi:polyisoprenyl-phosphate glycosyltransferase
MQSNSKQEAGKSPLISVVISLYNEADGVLNFWSDLREELTTLTEFCFEVIWVNDGSKDKTQVFIDEKIIVIIENNITHCSIEFSKNFGHEAAMIAGIDNAKGEAIICMDADGQHPPAEIAKMIAAFYAGNNSVLMERIYREDEGLFKKWLSSTFYVIINKLSSIEIRNNATDFFLISRQVADILKFNYREKNRLIRGYIQSLGFTLKVLPFKAPCRLSGESRYSYTKLVKLALDSVFAFSNKPLRISIVFSVLFILLTVLFGGYSLGMYLFGDTPPSGYTSIILLLTFSFSLLFLTITILSLYFEKVIQELRQRPLYLIKRLRVGNTRTSGDIHSSKDNDFSIFEDHAIMRVTNHDLETIANKQLQSCNYID